MDEARQLSGDGLRQALRDSREVLLSRVADLHDSQWVVPQQPGINPVAWELGHVAWFGEFWMLRGPHRLDGGFVHAQREARLTGPDEVYDSARLAYAQRWALPTISRGELLERMARQLDACIAAVPLATDDDAALYFPRLVLFHEDMHAEAFAWMRAALGYPAPGGCELPVLGGGDALVLDACTVSMGWPAGRAGFAFDNEEPAHEQALAGYAIDAAPVTVGQFLQFVEAGGYGDARLWPGAAGDWRAQAQVSHPQRWRLREGGRWQARWFDRWQDLAPAQPFIHVNAWEAEAYCRWAGRRLPSAAEWEHAATVAPAGRFRWGQSVWEWTSSAFQPYAGFRAGPYKDYSEPWFGDHRELRGGSFATQARMHNPCYRNFFQTHRFDVFAGFRTAAG